MSTRSIPHSPKPIQCKSCATVLATISPTGLVPSVHVREARICDTCRQFRPLYYAMQAADKEYASFSGRRDTYRPKQGALANFKNTHMEFNNWLMCVEAPATIEGPENALANTPLYIETGPTEEDDEQRGTKRAGPLSSDTKPRCSSSSPKGRRSTDSLPERKRLKFSNSVEFRDDYRPSNHYSRNNEAYHKGRYALAEGCKYLDTSGSTKTFLNFTGMKKVGKEWVDVWKEDDDDEKKESKGKVTKKAPPERQNDSGLGRVEEEDIQDPDAVVDPRAQRLAQRKNTTQAAKSTHRNLAVKMRNGRKKDSKVVTASPQINNVLQSMQNAISTAEDVADTEADAEKPTGELDRGDITAANNEVNTETVAQAQSNFEFAPHDAFAEASDGASERVTAKISHNDSHSQDKIDRDSYGAAQTPDKTVGCDGATLNPAAKEAHGKRLLAVVNPVTSITADEHDPTIDKGAMQALLEGGYRERQQEPFHGYLENRAGPALTSEGIGQNHEASKNGLTIPIIQNAKIEGSQIELQKITSATGPYSPPILSSPSSPKSSPETPHRENIVSKHSSCTQHAQHPSVYPGSQLPAVTAAVMTRDPAIDAIGEMRVMAPRKGKDQPG